MANSAFEGIPAEWVRDFRDEDTRTWVAAATRIGHMGHAATAFLESQLSERDSIHARRHAFCCLAAYLDGLRPGQDLRFDLGFAKRAERVPVRAELRRWMIDIMLVDLEQRHPRLDLLKQVLPSFEERIAENMAALEARRETITGNSKMPADAKARELAVIEEELGLWKGERTEFSSFEAFYERTRKRGRKKLTREEKLAKALRGNEWVFASFMAGATPGLLAYLGIPLDLLVQTLARLTLDFDNKIALVKNIPRVLLRFPRERVEDREHLGGLVEALVKRLPQPGGEPAHWVEYLGALRDLSTADDIGFRIAPDSLHSAYTKWRAARDPEVKEEWAIRAVREAERQFCPDTPWREKSVAEWTALPIFYEIMQNPGKGCEKWRRFDLEHRLKLARQCVADWQDKNPCLLITLVRLLKLLLNKELRTIGADKSPLRTCRRQINWIRPLVAAWNLRGTVNKDVATIATRVLCRAYDYAQEHNRITDYRCLLYTVLYALPEESILREMTKYAQTAAVRKHLRLVCTFIKTDEDDTTRKHKTFNAFRDAVWGNDDKGGILGMVRCLGRANKTQPLQDDADNILRWMIEQRVEQELTSSVDIPTRPSPGYRHELQHEIKTRSDVAKQEIVSLVNRLVTLEREVMDIGDNPNAVVRAMREASNTLRELLQKSRAALPLLERELVGHAIGAECELLAKRLGVLGRVFDGEDEKEAERVAKGNGETVTTPGDRNIVIRWMLRRFMLRELAPEANRVLQSLLSWRFVGWWMAAPFILCIAMRGLIAALERSWQLPYGSLLDSYAWLWGMPFVLIVAANAFLLGKYWKLKHRLPGGISRTSFLLPQMIGALFLGIMESFAADETWAMGFKGSRAIWLLNLVIFLAASYFFVRYVMLRDQERSGGAERNRKLKRRAWDVLAIGHWQAFALITLFALLQGNIMGDANRANLDGSSFDAFSDLAGGALPHIIEIRPPSLAGCGWLCLKVYPWAILAWTVRLFFFSAIFERIMNRARD